VFLTETADGTKAAIKLIPLDSGAAEAWLLRRELASHLSHPGLLGLLEFGRCDFEGESMMFAVMEYAEEDLSLVIPSRALAPQEVREVLRSVVDTLTYLHGQGFVHGRLTPANILAIDDRIKISSDRLLRSGDPAEDQLSTHSRAPEAEHGLTESSDVWSLGMTLVEMLTQKPPVWVHPTTDPRVPEELPEPYRGIARRCLWADPQKRGSLVEIKSNLEQPARPRKELVVKEPVVVVDPEAVPARPPRRRMALLAAGVFAGVILTSLILTRSQPPAQQTPAPAIVTPTPLPTPTPTPVPGRHSHSKTKQKPSDLPPTPTPVPTPTPAPKPEPKPKPAQSAARTVATGPVVDEVQPDVPATYLATIRGGVKAAVRVHVDGSGSVSDAEIASPSGSRYFDRIALETARRWKFSPGAGSGQAAESTRIIDFEFRRDGSHAAAR
jgi:protein TonB